jgi:hypothetical protein
VGQIKCLTEKGRVNILRFVATNGIIVGARVLSSRKRTVRSSINIYSQNNSMVRRRESTTLSIGIGVEIMCFQMGHSEGCLCDNDGREETKMIKYPECEKLQKVADKSDECGHFLDWLCQKGYAEKTSRKRMEELLAEYFEIDLVKVEKERRAILDDIRNRSDKER